MNQDYGESFDTKWTLKIIHKLEKHSKMFGNINKDIHRMWHILISMLRQNCFHNILIISYKKTNRR